MSPTNSLLKILKRKYKSEVFMSSVANHRLAERNCFFLQDPGEISHKQMQRGEKPEGKKKQTSGVVQTN